MNITSVFWILFAAFFIINTSVIADENNQLFDVSLQLQWNHQFQFAGYYAALEKGFYAAEGLNVEIRAGGYDQQGQAVRPVEEVLFGRADFGSTRTDLLIHHSLGLPVVVLANIYQHSPLIFLTLEEYAFNRLEDIGDRPVTLNLPEKGKAKRIDAETVAALQVANVDFQALNNSMPSWDLEDLISGKTQLVIAYATDQPYFISKAGKKPVTIDPKTYGLDFYGDLLFTSQALIEKKPKLVEKFRRASIRGWEYALAHQQEIIKLIVEHYKTRSPLYDEAYLLFEAEQTRELMELDIVEIGYINKHRWLQIAKTYQQLGLIDDYNLDNFLYQSTPQFNWKKYKAVLLMMLLFIVFASTAIFFLYRFNRKLKKEVLARISAEVQLNKLAETDHLTQIGNRRKFERNLTHEFSRAKRYGLPLSLIEIDIDYFKQINDQFGHQAGDEVIKQLAVTTGAQLRESDYFSRNGGEEFVVISANTTEDQILVLAERIRKANMNIHVDFNDVTIQYTISLGVSLLLASDEEGDDLFKRCDRALYQAKLQGRNRIVVG